MLLERNSLSVAIRLYHPLLPVDLPGHILCTYGAVADKFQLVVLHLCVPAKASMGKCHLRICPYFSSSVRHVLFI